MKKLADEILKKSFYENIKPVLKYNEDFGLDTFNLKGVLATERKIFPFSKNGIIYFVRNMHIAICNFEVEIEVDKAKEDEVLTVIEQFGLTKKSIVNKSERFFKRLEAMNNE